MVFSGISMIGVAFALFAVEEPSAKTLLPSLPETIGRRDDFSSACAREAHRHTAVKMPSIRWVLLLDICFPPAGPWRLGATCPVREEPRSVPRGGTDIFYWKRWLSIDFDRELCSNP